MRQGIEGLVAVRGGLEVGQLERRFCAHVLAQAVQSVTVDQGDAGRAQLEAERGLRARLAPQGITGTNYLEIDYVDPPPPMLPIAWTPNNVYIPSTPSTVSQFVNAASDIIDRLQRLDIEGTLANLNRLMTTTNDRLAAIDAKGLSDRATRTLDRLERQLVARVGEHRLVQQRVRPLGQR